MIEPGATVEKKRMCLDGQTEEEIVTLLKNEHVPLISKLRRPNEQLKDWEVEFFLLLFIWVCICPFASQAPPSPTLYVERFIKII